MRVHIPGRHGTSCNCRGLACLSNQELRVFFFFSNRLGLLSSIVISAVLTLLLLSFCNVI